jgi:hypothetical protein
LIPEVHFESNRSIARFDDNLEREKPAAVMFQPNKFSEFGKNVGLGPEFVAIAVR